MATKLEGAGEGLTGWAIKKKIFFLFFAASLRILLISLHFRILDTFGFLVTDTAYDIEVVSRFHSFI